jgi:hypothetical protein
MRLHDVNLQHLAKNFPSSLFNFAQGRRESGSILISFSRSLFQVNKIFYLNPSERNLFDSWIFAFVA